MKNFKTLGLSLALLLTSVSANACLIGQVTWFALPTGYETKEYAQANGQIIETKTNYALYSLIGNRFGGDGTRTFALPKLPQIGKTNGYICVDGTYPSRPN